MTGKQLLIVSLLLTTPASAAAQTQQRTAKLKGLLDRLPHQQTEISACIVSLPEGKVVYERNADKVLIPASNQKIVTAVVALALLGSDFGFQTILARQAQNLVLIGTGDPGLGDPKIADEEDQSPLVVFESFARAAASDSLRNVENIIVDDRVFDENWLHPSWESEDIGKWYAAPVGGLNFNDNCIDVSLIPTTPGRSVRYEVFPPCARVKVDNECVTGDKKPWIIRHGDGFSITLRGETDRQVTLQPVAVSDPGLFTGDVLQKVLGANGIQVSGEVVRAPPQFGHSDLQVLASHTTPLRAVLRRALSDSQNLFAECLMKRCAAGARISRSSAGWGQAAEIFKRTLQSWDIDTRGMVIADGSGLSRMNRMSARQIVHILKFMYLNTKHGAMFMDSLANNAARGTLTKRMRDIPRKVWGKTGYMRGIRALSGYVASDDDRWYAFSILFNDIPGGTAPYNRIHDEVCRALVHD